jgi:hypothetical protein
VAQRDPGLGDGTAGEAEDDRTATAEAVGEVTAEEPGRDRGRAEDREDHAGLAERRAEVDGEHYPKERERERSDPVDRARHDQDPYRRGQSAPWCGQGRGSAHLGLHDCLKGYDRSRKLEPTERPCDRSSVF